MSEFNRHRHQTTDNRLQTTFRFSRERTGVTVHKETDVLIRCKKAPILIGVRDEHGRYRIPLIQKRGQWQPQTPPKKQRRELEMAGNVYDLPRN